MCDNDECYMMGQDLFDLPRPLRLVNTLPTEKWENDFMAGWASDDRSSSISEKSVDTILD